MHLIILKINFVFLLLLKFTLCDKKIGDSCSLKNSKENKGICKYINNCTSALDNEKPISCNPDILDQIICCQSTESGFEIIKSECIVETTGEIGAHKLLEHCPTIQRDIKKGYKAPVICDEKFCEDLVCCPINNNTNRLKNICKNYDEPFQVITTRLEHFNFSCAIKNSNKKGFITKKEYCKSSSDQKICKYDFCEGWTCCASENFIKNQECVQEFHSNIKYIGDSCTDLLSGTDGTCRLHNQCPQVIGRAFSNITVCGYDCCELFFCCPEINSHQKSESSNFVYYFWVCVTTKYILF